MGDRLAYDADRDRGEFDRLDESIRRNGRHDDCRDILQRIEGHDETDATASSELQPSTDGCIPVLLMTVAGAASLGVCLWQIAA